MMHVVVSNSPVEAAWAAFDAAAIGFHRMYGVADPLFDSAADRARRMYAAEEVVRLWDEWRTLFLGESGDPRPAA